MVIGGDLNIDLLDPRRDTSNHFSDLLDVFNLQNLVSNLLVSCLTKGSLVDIIIINKPRFLDKTQCFVTGISNFHKLVVAVLRSYYKKFLQRISLIEMLKVQKNNFPPRV